MYFRHKKTVHSVMADRMDTNIEIQKHVGKNKVHETHYLVKNK